MVTKKNERDIVIQEDNFEAGKIISGALYILTALFILGFLYQAIVSFFL